MNATSDFSIGFVHRDRLGSVVTVTDEHGDVVDNKSYDPFGKPRKGTFERIDPIDPATLTQVAELDGFTIQTTRGFTDHEHLDDAELIHMNGRAYDYNLGRFLSVDPFIQSPGNSQSMNPYSYIMNNPLSGTDPSGYCASSRIDEVCESAPSHWGGTGLLADGSNLVVYDNGNDKEQNPTPKPETKPVDITVQKTDTSDKVEKVKGQSTSGITDPPSPRNCQERCDKTKFSDAEQKTISNDITKMSAGIMKETYGSYDAAAEALHNSGLVEYFKKLGIEGWAVIDQKSFSIKEVGTGFNSHSAVGIYDGAYEKGDVAWHTHPGGAEAWNGDLKSAIRRGATRVYASGNDLTYIDARFSSFKDLTSTVTNKKQWDAYKGPYYYDIVNVTKGTRREEGKMKSRRFWKWYK